MPWIRTCQECGHKQETKPPAEYKNDSWRNVKCKACKSEALDYGREVSSFLKKE
jgi:hypothetical protein